MLEPGLSDILHLAALPLCCYTPNPSSNTNPYISINTILYMGANLLIFNILNIRVMNLNSTMDSSRTVVGTSRFQF